MWSRRTIAALAVAAAGCASLTSSEDSLRSRVDGALRVNGLGGDALRVIDNLLRHGAPPPPAASPAVLELLTDPLKAADAAALFARHVPAALQNLDAPPFPGQFDDLLNRYITNLAAAQRLLREAVAPFDENAILRRLDEGLVSANQLLSVADAVDLARLERANALFLDATARFAAGMRTVREYPPPQSFRTPIGMVVIGSRGNDRHVAQAALIIDPGGDDYYERSPVGGGAVAVIIDVGGNDQYAGADLALRGYSAIVDLDGDDRYLMEGPGLGAAIAGAALVVDYAGRDLYRAKFFGQGAAAFGVGALIDLAGDDRYELRAWGQGFGLAHGLGLLWDRAGHDRYGVAGEPDAFERGSGLSGAQGAAFGFRELIAGGVGILRDDAGDDTYEAQMFAQGLGYYYALGVLWDRGGNDAYHGYRYAQGNGVHQAVGVLRDEAGDDRYSITLGYGQGMGLDMAVGVLRDDGGSDLYRSHYGAQGAATANGFGLLDDRTGADRYELGPDHHAWGEAEWYRGLPSVAVLLRAEKARFARAGEEITPSSQPPWRHERAKPAQSDDCGTRAIALIAQPSLDVSALRSSCWRLQAAARSAFVRLGAPLPADVSLPTFLRQRPPSEELD